MKSGLIKALMVPAIVGGVILGSCDSGTDESKNVPKPDTTVQASPFAGKKVMPVKSVALSPTDSILAEGCYTVQKGDNLYTLGEAFYGEGVLGGAIADWNGFDIDAKLHPGQDLMLNQIGVRHVLQGEGWSNVAYKTGLTVDQAQEKFHWMGNQLVPGEVYFVERRDMNSRIGQDYSEKGNGITYLSNPKKIY